MAKKILLSFVLVIFIAFQSVSADETKHNKVQKPRVAVVLAGGGALGFAHIGVLKVLEENGIYPDLIVGTSMGGLVGALYSYGYSAGEIKEEVGKIDWLNLFVDVEKRSYIPYRQRFAQYKYNIDIPFDWDGINSNEGFSTGQKILDLFYSLVGPCSNNDDFDNLDIPFRCVSCDISTGRQYVFDHGSLADAMRATMSIPGIFVPVEHEGHILVDGMVVNNLPVSVAKDLGAEVIIAVNLGSKEVESENIRSAIGIASQMINIYVSDEVERQKEMADLVISPNLAGYTSSSYLNLAEILQLGEIAAQESLPRIKELVKDYETRERNGIPVRVSPVIDEVRITGLEEPWKQRIESLFNSYEGDTLDISKLNQIVETIHSSNQFVNIRHHVEMEDGKNILYIDMERNHAGPNYLRLGLFYENNFNVDESYVFNFLLGLELSDIIFKNSILKNEFEILSGFKWDLDYFIPFCNYFFVRPEITLSYRPEVAEYIDGEQYGDSDIFRTQGMLEVGTFNDYLGEMAVGMCFEYLKIEHSKFYPYKDFSGMLNCLYFISTIDNVNSCAIPEYGTLLELEFDYYDKHFGSEDTYLKLTAEFWEYFQLGQRNSIGLRFFGTMDFATDVPDYDRSISSYVNIFPGYTNGELMYANLLSAVLDYKFNLFRLPMGNELAKIFLILRGGVAAAYDNFDLFSKADADIMFGYGAGIGVSTFIGPMIFGCSFNDDKRFMFHISIGTKF